MCIIVIKNKGAEFPPVKTITRCMDRNPDGFSMAWNENREVRTFRTMDRGEALARYKKLSSTLDPATTGLIFHARIATHGSKKVENCHCFIENDIVFTFKDENYKASIAFAHNGILRDIPNRGDLTDSETFFRDYFLPVLRASGWETAHSLAKAVAGTSKFAFITNNGNIVRVGNYIEAAIPGQKGKLYFSNTSYMEYETRSIPLKNIADITPERTTQQSLWGRHTVLYNDGVHGLKPTDIRNKKN